MNKKAQQTMSMPFGVIFSIILIVVFIATAFFVIKHFLGLQKCSELSIFIKNLQDKIDTVWKSSSKTDYYSASLPGAIDEVCFVDFNKTTTQKYDGVRRRYSFYQPNFFFYPPEEACEISYYNFKHINTTEATSNNNPLCFENKEGSKIKISKGFYDSLVKIGKE